MSQTESHEPSHRVQPIFMFGFERSGTTLLSMIVGAHPRIAVPLSVTGLWYRYGHRLREYNDLAEPRDLEKLVDDLLREERIRLWDVELDREELLDGLPLRDYGAVIARFHETYARAKGKRHWANLDIATLDHMDDANVWCPDARFVHIVRDGRDVAMSHRTMPYGASNTLDCAENWVRRLETNVKMGRILGPDRYHVIRFEDLVLETEPTLMELCEFLGVEYSPAMLEYGSMVGEKVPDHRRWLWPDLDKAPVGAKVGNWKRRMSKSRRIVFEGAANSMLKQLGYDDAFPTVPKHPLAYLHEAWCFLDRGARVKRLLRRIGLHRPSKLERSWSASPKGSDGADYRRVQTDAFGQLVDQGIYDRRFEHGKAQKDFVRTSIEQALEQMHPANSIRILDCGCGPGAWLDFIGHLHSIPGDARLYGFDLTPEMIDVARQRLEGLVPPDHLQVGDVQDHAAYDIAGADARYDLIYTYDVIQQLPRNLQFEACQCMLGRVADGGCLIIFDHDSDSPYGRRMGRKKFLTRYLGLPLVPRYYCNARYPRLAGFARLIEADARYSTRMCMAPNGRKRALIVWRSSAPHKDDD